MEKQKRVMAVHDISCFGKCSLTVALPILSAAGIETCVIPTAVLSTHTGGFEGYTFRDLTKDIPGIARHWKSLKLHFDGIYTGYLGSYEQLDIVSALIDDFHSEDTLVCVDPVMGDGGALYPAFGQDYPEGMAKLCGKADIIVPNLTEAALLLGEPYRGRQQEEQEIARILRRLAELGPEKVVLTGVSFNPARVGCAVYDAATGETDYAFANRVEGFYHGTGDVFASSLLGALMNGLPLAKAARLAVSFTEGSVRRTFAAGTDVRYGVNFEAGLSAYGELLK